MPPPPTRREQMQLDELLSDIYRGIEALPDKSHYSTYHDGHQFNKSSSAAAPSHGNQLIGRTYAKEYELPASSPFVKQHLAAVREDLQAGNVASLNTSQQPYTPQGTSSSRQPHRSTLKRSTANTPDPYNNLSQAAPQSLASFVTSTPTPENKRRVRILDHPESLNDKKSNYRTSSNHNHNHKSNDDDADYAADDYGPYDSRFRPEKVKYVNTNKLIYHQERSPDDYQLDQADRNKYRVDNNPDEADEDDDLDGKTRVEYYHTTWLDRQLGRASKRRSSKELNERQVKEKAMIEELKRSLKSGAITLRQSLRGKKNKSYTSDNNFTNHHQVDSSLDSRGNYHESPSSHHSHKSNAIGSGLATIPRNYNKVYYPATPVCYDTWVNKSRGSTSPKSSNHHHSHHPHHHKHPSAGATIRQAEPISGSFIIEEPSNSYYSPSLSQQRTPATPKQTSSGANYLLTGANSNSNNYNSSTLNNQMQSQHQTRQPAEPAAAAASSNLYSRTLPNKSRRGEHSLIESHLRGNINRSYTREPALGSTLPFSSSSGTTTAVAGREPTPIANNMRNPSYQSPVGGLRSPSGLEHQQLRQRPENESISNIPSATDVVRSALSRSNSQINLNQLNKTINLLPNSPPPYSPSPSGQQVKAVSPPMSPSPAALKCNTLNNQRQMPQTHSSATPDGLQRVYGTRTLDRNVAGQQSTQTPVRQPIYANPHASLMQHKAEQQARQPQRNTASIREFNELDNLLRSLSPNVVGQHNQSRVNITPGFSAKPAQPSIGGYGSSVAATAAPTGRTGAGANDLYAHVQKPAYQAPAADQTRTRYLQQNNALANQQQQQLQQQSHLPYTIDVTDKKVNDDCLRRQDLSEFEAPIELLPSMEDYQNITKLNPVKNHYWYKPNMSRDRAISLLKDKPQGTFIVRDSTSFRGAYGLALKVAKLPKNVLNNASLRNFNSNDPSAELIRHFLIEPTQGGVRLKGYENEPVFNSLPDLIYQHSLTELALPCKLIIPRADIEDSNFNLKQKQFFEDFVASKELAKHLPYERTSPDGGYRKYPGDVYVHNEHRIIFE